MIQSPQWKLLCGQIDDNKSIEYLPIEALRGQGTPGFFCGELAVRTFQSSGTTAKERSQSLFSKEGLALYRERSIAQFSYVLDQVQPPDKSSPRLGLSLVPDSTTWPDSSLAQMMTWIAEEYDLQFVSEGELKAAILANTDRRLWLFGTAFHWVNALDSGDLQVLPPESVLFETGGTKGRSREITRPALYTELSKAFGVSADAIVSEYGMCEIACQAYDFVPCGESLDLAERRFKFYRDVEVAVLDRPGSAKSSGRGGLMIRDPARIDYPWFFRTEDLAELHDGSFKLLGRTPKAALKGCSLGAEKLLSGTRPDPKGVPPQKTKRLAPHTPAISLDERITLIARFLGNFISAPATTEALAQELGSHAAATAALQDLASGIPDHRDHWNAAAASALGKRGHSEARWLVILPDNHSLVGLYPLSLAYVAGLSVTVRMPKAFDHSTSLIARFLNGLGQLPGAMVDVLQSDWRIGESQTMPAVDAILCYGSSETIQTIQYVTKLPVRGFGHRVSASVATLDDLKTSLDEVVSDCLGLGQIGCMSSRVVFVVSDGPSHRVENEFLEALQASGRRFWSAPIPWRQRAGLDAEFFRYATLGSKVRLPDSDSSPLVCWTEVGTNIDFANLDNYLARTQFCLPIVSGVADDLPSFALNLSRALKAKGNLGSLTAPRNQVAKIRDSLRGHGLLGACIRPLGEANAPKWDGMHEGLPLFDPWAST